MREQARQIKRIKESKNFDNYFNPQKAEVKNLRYWLKENGDIGLKWNKWYHLTAHKMFIYVVNFFIVLNLIMLALDNPLNDPDAAVSKALRVINIMVCIFFVIEAFIKIISLGFCSTSLQSNQIKRKAYMCNILNIFDFVIAMMHVVDLCIVHN